MVKIAIGVVLAAAASGAAILAARPGTQASRQHAAAAAVGHDLIPAGARRPVLVELYQSQGCSSCPPASANVNAIVDRPDVVALSFGVTYWDQLGWKDSFAKPQFTARQWDYARAKGRANVATPQIWINGRRTIVGDNPAELAKEIAAARSTGPALSIGQRRASIGASQAPTGGADIWLAQYDPRDREVPIRAGENNGRTLPHRDIVTSLTMVGHWTGKAASVAVPNPPAGQRSAVFLQAGKGGPVLAVAKG